MSSKSPLCPNVKVTKKARTGSKQGDSEYFWNRETKPGYFKFVKFKVVVENFVVFEDFWEFHLDHIFQKYGLD